jgi:hypothetical protein
MIRDRIIDALKRRGGVEVKRLSKYIVFSADDDLFYLGRNGACRRGQSISKSVPVSGTFLRQLIGYSALQWDDETLGMGESF